MTLLTAMNHETALPKIKAVTDRTSEAVEASEANQVFFVFGTAPRDAERRLAIKKIFVYDDNLVSLIE